MTCDSVLGPNIRTRFLRAAIPPAVLALWGAALLLALPSPARADETPFASIYTTEVMPAGAKEIEQWATWANRKTDESFNGLEGRTEFEYGFSDRLLGSLYLNYDYTHADPHGPNAADGPESTSRFTGYSAEFIYQFLNPVTDPIGLALYLEPSAGAGERAIETKLLLQKDFLDDRLIFAGNLNLEYVWVHDPAAGVWDQETALEFYFGGSYRIAPGWFLGAEFLNENAYSGHIFAGAHAQTSAFYLGPVVHYASEKWWATLAVDSQLPWAGNPGHAPGAVIDGFVTDAERLRVRFRMGITI